MQIVAPESRDLDIQIIVDEIELLLQRHKGFMLAQQPPQNIAQLDDHTAGHVRIVANQRRNRVQRIEQKMRIDLRGQRVHARLEQQLLVLLEIHFDSRVVPDLHRNRDGHHRGQQDQRDSPTLPASK